MRIGTLSQRTGVSQRLLRYYEEQGLLRPRRRPSGYRDYHDDDIRTVRHIRTLLAAGLSTHTIAELMPCMVDDGSLLVPACPDMLSDLHRERDRLSDTAAGLLAARDVLDTIIEATPPADAAEPDACAAPGPPPADGAGTASARPAPWRNPLVAPGPTPPRT
ncbi:MerR family transcriptional regulator [Streptomyces sp. NPDC020965]|uniref:MerR family transcriptional regulator n=1 Tax=Streptomyces sp. NPDC020965 TaxID=3365105 RepID=UPI0037A739C5